MHRNGVNFVRILLGFAIAVGIAYVLAALFFTSANLIRLAAVGADISLSDALRTYWFDLRGMAPSLVWTQYGTLIAIGFAIAFPVAGGLRSLAARSHSARRLAPYLYPLAGAAAITVILIRSYSEYEVFLIAGARGTVGWLAQCAAGAAGGYLFQLAIGRANAQEVRA